MWTSVKIQKLIVLTTGLDKSPKVSQRSAIVINPTSKTTKRPTNLTEIQQANIVPVKANQNHHLAENSIVCSEDTFTAPIIEPIMKQRSIGSSRIYCVRVIRPTSKESYKKITETYFLHKYLPKMTSKDEKTVADKLWVNASTVKKVAGTIVAPRAVQN